MIALGLVGRIPRGLIGATALIFVLFVVQSILVYAGPSLAALHPLNGFLIALLSVWIAVADPWVPARRQTMTRPSRLITDPTSRNAT